MELKQLKPRKGEGTLRIDDSDDLVVIENIGANPIRPLPENGAYIEKHAVIVICTEGMAQFEYDGQTIQLRKNDMFIYMMLRTVITNFMSSQNYNCRQIWFTSSEAWSLDMYGKKSLADLIHLKHQPKVTLSDYDASMLDGYFQLLCRQMRDRSHMLYPSIVRSLFSTMLLKILSIMRDDKEQAEESSMHGGSAPGLHQRHIADKFLQLVEQSDGRIRKVDTFAGQLNITSKYLSTLLKETLKRRPSEMIQFFTLKAIKHRLRFTDMTMQEIANDLQFPNASFFGKYFKEHAGMTPLEYRKKYQI
jgi:AraC-like DNA-binding protein